MPRRSLRRTAAVVAAVALLAGCSQQISGVGSYSSGQRNVADAKIDIVGSDSGEVDKLTGNAIFDVQKFWTDRMPKIFGKQYQPVRKFYSVDPDKVDETVPCTRSAAAIRGNAFYCPSADIVAWDRKVLFPALIKKFDKFLIAMVIAHEWGHVIQHRTEMPSSKTIVIESQADCYAGAFTASVLRGEAPHWEIDRAELDQALAGYLLFRDPLGASQNDRNAHGSGFDRIVAFQEGFDEDVKHCSTFDSSRKFTEIQYANPRDEANKGNMPYNQALQLGPQDLAEYWNTTFTNTYNRQWQAPKVQPYTSERPSCDGQAVSAVAYCPGDNTIYYNQGDSMQKVYRDTGDFAPMILIGVAYGQAVRKQLGRTVNGEDALLGSICLAGAYARAAFERKPGQGQGKIILSPGDLDEAVQALLNYVGATGFFEARGTVGFDRVASFRKGFNDVQNC